MNVKRFDGVPQDPISMLRLGSSLGHDKLGFKVQDLKYPKESIMPLRVKSCIWV